MLKRWDTEKKLLTGCLVGHPGGSWFRVDGRIIGNLIGLYF